VISHGLILHQVGNLHCEGALCGSIYLNNRLEDHLTRLLQDEHYLDCENVTRESLIEACLVEFENNLKRTFDVTKTKSPIEILLPGLKANVEKGFTSGTLYLTWFDTRLRAN